MSNSAYSCSRKEIYEKNQKAITPMTVELLAPAGNLEAGIAALQYGADAIYLGLENFSARADADNFTIEELDSITAYAHAQRSAKKVYVALNTLVLNSEIPLLIKTLRAVAEIGVDALIVQDWGLVKLVRKYVPFIRLHGSTQLAVHHPSGVQALKELGFQRVTLARELTLKEIHACAAVPGIEVEAFIHGALCYSYSGLCYFSSQLLGRSGNRGRCAYPCRARWQVAAINNQLVSGQMPKPDFSNSSGTQGLAFSMKDLALSPQAVELRESGVSSLKIEGRKKSALFVAATVHLYRQILDGSLSEQERQALEAEVQTIFSRPWTPLYFHSPRNRGVVDTQWVGHRGARIGTLKAVVREGKKVWIRFKSARALSRYDGLQIDIPGIDRPFGFSVQELRTVNCRNCKKKASSTIPLSGKVPAGVEIEVALPRGYPTLPLEVAIYCSSSQQVKQRYRVEKPNMRNYRTRWGLKLVAELEPNRLILNAQVDHPLHSNLKTTVFINGSFAAAQNQSKMEIAARQALEKLGDSRFFLDNWEWKNPQGLFVPLSQLNDARRVLVKDLEAKLSEADYHWCAAVEQSERKTQVANRQSILTKELQWSIKVDSFSALQGFEQWENVDQLVFDIGKEPPNILVEQMQKISQRLGMQRVRLALPVITRNWEAHSLQTKIADLKAAGFYRWEISNISAFSFLAPLANQELWIDGALAVVNNLAAAKMIAMEAQGFALSIEDTLSNMAEIVADFADKATVIVYQDTPLFISESCPYASLFGQCLGHRCSYDSMQLTSTQYPTNTIIACRQRQAEGQSVNRSGCRAVIMNNQPYSIAEHLELLVAAGVKKVRVDFLHKQYSGQQVQNLWRELRQATKLGHNGNFERSW